MTTKYEARDWVKTILGPEAPEQQIQFALSLHQAFLHPHDRTARMSAQARNQVLETGHTDVITHNQILGLHNNHSSQAPHFYDPQKNEAKAWSILIYTNRAGETVTLNVPFSELEVGAIGQMRQVIKPWNEWNGSGPIREIKPKLIFPQNSKLLDRSKVLNWMDRNYATLKWHFDNQLDQLQREGIKADVERLLDLLLSTFPDLAEIDEQELYELQRHPR